MLPAWEAYVEGMQALGQQAASALATIEEVQQVGRAGRPGGAGRQRPWQAPAGGEGARGALQPAVLYAGQHQLNLPVSTDR